MLQSKKIYDMTQEELEKKSRTYHGIFIGYVVAAIGISIINGFYGLQSINNVMNYTTDATIFLLLFNTVMISIIFLFIIFLWMIMESSYYKMLQMFYDIMIYMKQQEEKTR